MNGEDYFTDEQLSEGIKIWDAICGDKRPGYFPLIEVLSRIRTEQARKEAVNEFRMDELDGVMHSVDKWLKGDALKNNPATRAADAREVALKAIEAEKRRADQAEKELADFMFIPSGREYEIKCCYAACKWGQGLIRTGQCSGHGNPRDPHCPKFKEEA